jgi:hypothetical protein
MPDYPEADFPWTFYFNGVAMPQWGANWPSFALDEYKNWDWDVGPRDLYLIRHKIDRVGTLESANPHVFVYAVQEILCLLLTERKGVLGQIREWAGTETPAEEIYDGLLAAAFEMRASVRREGRAFWTSGYEADRLLLVEAMRRASLPAADPDFLSPPHVQSWRRHLERLWKDQVKTLHHVAASGNLSQELRKKLSEL